MITDNQRKGTLINTILRNFVCNFSAVTIAIVLFIIARMLDKNSVLGWKMILLIILSLISAVLLSILAGYRERLEQICIHNDLQGMNMEVVQRLIKESLRSEYVKNDTQTLYYMKNKLNRWLTNEITVNLSEDMIYVSLPKVLKRKLEELLAR